MPGVLLGRRRGPCLDHGANRRSKTENSNREAQMKNRFHATTATLLAVLALAAPTAAQFSEPPVMDKPQAGYYRFKIGRVDVIAVSDGGGAFDILGVVPQERKEAAAQIMAKSLVKSPVFISVNAYIILLDG